MRRLAAVLSLCLLGLLSLTALPSAPVGDFLQAAAQDPPPTVDYTEWQDVAARAEAKLEEPNPASEELMALRAELVDWRTRLTEAQTANGNRISILREQIDALGPAPAEGETETEEIASRRAELNSQLRELEAPRLKAEEAYRRAEGLIREIDSIDRERQTRQLLERGPTPLNPSHWATAATELGGSTTTIWEQLQAAWSQAERRQVFWERLPVIGILLGLAAVLLYFGRTWMERLTRYVERRERPSRRGVGGFLVSLGQVALPLGGLILIVGALIFSELFGELGLTLIRNLPVLGLAVFGGRWLTRRLFPDDPDQAVVLNLKMSDRAEMRFYGTLLGLLFGLTFVLFRLAEFENYSDASRAVINFPLICLNGLVLFRLGTILRRNRSRSKPEETADAVSDMRRYIGALIGSALKLSGVAAPLIGLIGYTNAAAFFVYPMILSLGLIGLLIVIQGVLLSLYRLTTGKSPEEADQALAPVVISFLLFLLSLPLFALFWGARVTDLTEAWTKFQLGFTVAGITISPSVFITFVFVFLIGYGVTRFFKSILRTSVLPKTRIDPGGRTAILSGIGYTGIFLSALIAITSAGIDLSSLAIVAGALSVGIGFGLQTIVSNFVSGIILLIERPISEGDWIEVAGQSGYVRDISVRSTRIETFDRTDVIIPNADLISGVVINWTRGNLIGRVKVPVGVAYGTDTRRVESILREVAEDHPLVAMNPPPAVMFLGFGADSLDFEIRAILRDVNFVMTVHSDMNHAIAKRFAEEGIEIPFAQRDVWLRNPEALTGQRQEAGPEDTEEEPSQGDQSANEQTDTGKASS